MTINLEFACTEKERNEAKSLHLHSQFGGGPKWRSSIFFYAVAVICFTILILWMKQQSSGERWMFIVLFILVFGALKFFHHRERQRRKAHPGMAKLQISENDIAFEGDETTRMTLPWTGFHKCLESPNLFVLVNRTNNALIILPKRAFPDESAQASFRTVANQPKPAGAMAAAAVAPDRLSGKGIVLTVQLKYRDYLVRMLTSWRTRGICIVIYLFLLGTFVYTEINPPPHAVVPGWKVFLIMMAMVIPMFGVMWLFIAWYSWLTERKYLVPQNISLSTDGIEFASSDANGVMPWSTYKYYLETRWAFFIWRPQGSVWFMAPKRAFSSSFEMEQCRELLQKNLKPSRWFFY